MKIDTKRWKIKNSTIEITAKMLTEILRYQQEEFEQAQLRLLNLSLSISTCNKQPQILPAVQMLQLTQSPLLFQNSVTNLKLVTGHIFEALYKRREYTFLKFHPFETTQRLRLYTNSEAIERNIRNHFFYSTFDTTVSS